jgi:hypothetical protein
VLEAPIESVRCEAFNIGRSDQNFRIRELAEIVRQTVPNCTIEYAADAGPDTRCYRVDCDKLPRTLNTFKPAWTADRGARELYRAYLNCSLTPEDFEGSRYQRLAHIKHLQEIGVLDGTLRWHALQRASASAAHFAF